MVISDLFLMSFVETRIFHKFGNFRIARANYGNEVYACDRSHAGVFVRGIAWFFIDSFLFFPVKVVVVTPTMISDFVFAYITILYGTYMFLNALFEFTFCFANYIWHHSLHRIS